MDDKKPWVRGSGSLMDAPVTQDNTYRIGWFAIVKRSFNERLAFYIKSTWSTHSVLCFCCPWIYDGYNIVNLRS